MGQHSSKARRRLTWLAIIGLCALSLLLSLILGSAFQTWDWSATDLFVRWRHALGSGEEAVDWPITFIAIDERCQQEYGLYGRGQWLARRPFVEQALACKAKYSGCLGTVAVCLLQGFKNHLLYLA